MLFSFAIIINNDCNIACNNFYLESNSWCNLLFDVILLLIGKSTIILITYSMTVIIYILISMNSVYIETKLHSSEKLYFETFEVDHEPCWSVES